MIRFGAKNVCAILLAKMTMTSERVKTVAYAEEHLFGRLHHVAHMAKGPASDPNKDWFGVDISVYRGGFIYQLQCCTMYPTSAYSNCYCYACYFE